MFLLHVREHVNKKHLSLSIDNHDYSVILHDCEYAYHCDLNTYHGFRCEFDGE